VIRSSDRHLVTLTRFKQAHLGRTKIKYCEQKFDVHMHLVVHTAVCLKITSAHTELGAASGKNGKEPKCADGLKEKTSLCLYLFHFVHGTHN
jgi:hypothetical protein